MPDDDQSASIRRSLRDDAATTMLLSGMWSRDDEAIRGHRRLVDEVPAGGGSHTAGSLMVLARCEELEGRAQAHEQLVRQALAVDPLFSCALAELSWVLADRGDAPGALVTFDLSGAAAGDRERFALLHLLSMTGPVLARRNASCPCRSGRKHKHCCARTGGWPLQTRAVWLIEKAMTYAARPAQREAVLHLLRDAVDPAMTPPQLDALVGSRVVREAALFAGGLLARFQAERSVLLPADEAALLDSWVGARQRVLRCVVRSDDSKGGVALDLVTGDVVDLAYIAPDAGPGDVMIGAPLPDAEGKLAMFAAALPPEQFVADLTADWGARGPAALVALEATLVTFAQATDEGE